jgi:hypothetical protein
MVRITISVEAFEAIAQTLPLGSVGYENKTTERGRRLIWLDRAMVDRLCAMFGRGRATATPFCGWRRRRRNETQWQGFVTGAITKATGRHRRDGRKLWRVLGDRPAVVMREASE